MAKRVIIIAGNIGAGKSTLVKYMTQRSNFKCIQEFIDKSWRDLFYSDRKRYTGPFEMSCLMGRKARYLNAKKESNVVIFDRGLIEAREIFVQNSFDEGFLTFADLEDYDRNLKKALDELGRMKDESSRWMECIIVYLKTSPKICFDRQNKRMAERGDKGEVIPLEYFERIHNYYEKFMLNIDETYKKWGLISMPKLLIIDAAQDISKNPGYLERTFQIIKDSLDIKDEKKFVPQQKPQQMPRQLPKQNVQPRPQQNVQQKPQQQQPKQNSQVQQKPNLPKPQNPQKNFPLRHQQQKLQQVNGQKQNPQKPNMSNQNRNSFKPLSKQN